MPEHRERVVFPTCVGMNRQLVLQRAIHVRVPHVRGDEPAEMTDIDGELTCSPRAWG